MKEITFTDPGFFWLFLLLPVLVWWHLRNRKRLATPLKVSSLEGFKSISRLEKLKPVLFLIRMFALSALIVALARPRTINISSRTKSTKGIDIVLAVDVSASMLARDLKPDRMEALKEVAQDFVMQRQNDRIGLVVYAAEAYTKTPVTSDNAMVYSAVRSINYDGVLEDGTGIGMGLATAVNRLKDSKAKSKIVILMTDGVNNAGFIEPATASDIAKEYGIKVYTIGIGTNGLAEFPYALNGNGELLFKMMPVTIDETLLKNIADNTGGKYFRATNNNRLKTIYDEINKLETSEVAELKFYDYEEKFRPFALIALGLILIEVGLRNTIFRGFI